MSALVVLSAASGTTAWAQAAVSSPAAALARPAGTTPPTLAVPPPTGPEHVGTIAVPVFDPSRHRELMIQIWYPTRADRGRPARYFTPAVARLVAAADHIPASITATIVTHAFQASPPAPGRHPVVLYSPGSHEMRNDATALVEELASRGFVTVGIDHTGESQFVQFPGGRIVRGTFKDTGDAANTREVGIRVADVAAVLRALPAISRHGLLAHALDLRRIGMFGFSLGGATAASAMRQLPAIQAGLDLDGSLYGDAATTPLARPFLFLVDANPGTDPSFPSWWRALRGFRREIQLRRSGHLSFTDIVGFIDTLGLRSRYSPLQQRLLLGTIPDRAAITATRQLITAYFGYFLNHDRHALTMLNAPGQQNRYLLRLR